MQRLILLLFATIALVGCGQYTGTCPPGTELCVWRLDPATAIQDAQSALQKGDRRLVAVAGYGLEVPGTQLTAGMATSQYGIKEVYGASDVGDDYTLAAVQKARAYATLYNQFVLKQTKLGHKL